MHLVRPPTALVLVTADPAAPHHELEPGHPAGLGSWQWVLRPVDGGRRTRLSLPWHLVEPVTFVMERQMLLGIKRRAEASVAGAPVAA